MCCAGTLEKVVLGAIATEVAEKHFITHTSLLSTTELRAGHVRSHSCKCAKKFPSRLLLCVQ